MLGILELFILLLPSSSLERKVWKKLRKLCHRRIILGLECMRNRLCRVINRLLIMINIDLYKS